MTNIYHTPVLLQESVKGLITDPSGVYVDVTFGGGGHSKQILAELNDDGKLFAFDQDPAAMDNDINDSRFNLINQNFSFLENYLQMYNALPVDGILADLGVSSHQFDTADRGFSTRFNGKLDMRMNTNADLTAEHVVNEYEAKTLHLIFQNYGELNRSKSLAQEIESKRAIARITTIEELKKVTKKFAPPGKENRFYAQLFQAIRIEVNKELEVLENLLTLTTKVVKKGGRISVITYHSLEDRIVKNHINKGKFKGELEKDFYGNPIKPFQSINRKPIIPSDEELKENPRARSAKLRIAERIAE